MKTTKLIAAIAIPVITVCTTAFVIPTHDGNQTAPFADKYWVLQSSTVTPAIDLDGDGKPDTDIRVMMEDCDKDDAEMYKTGGKLMKHEGAEKCDEEDEQVAESGTWSYNAATKQITSKHHDTRKAQTMTVKNVAGNTMTLSYEFTSSKGKHMIIANYKTK